MTTFINLITFSRILLAVVIFMLLMSPNGYLLSLILFFFAGISDYFDGYLARKYKIESQFGEVLDPIADKILILFVLIIGRLLAQAHDLNQIMTGIFLGIISTFTCYTILFLQ